MLMNEDSRKWLLEIISKIDFNKVELEFPNITFQCSDGKDKGLKKIKIIFEENTDETRKD